jgi:hypothetical protein
MNSHLPINASDFKQFSAEELDLIFANLNELSPFVSFDLQVDGGEYTVRVSFHPLVHKAPKVRREGSRLKDRGDGTVEMVPARARAKVLRHLYPKAYFKFSDIAPIVANTGWKIDAKHENLEWWCLREKLI